MLVGLLFLSIIVPAHEIYVSITTIRYQSEAQQLMVRVRIFTDNLDDAIRHWYGHPANLNMPNELPEADSLIADYVRRHLRLIAVEKQVTLHWVKKRYDADVTETYWQSDSLVQPKQLIVENSILTDIIELQTNIVRVRIGKNKKQYNMDAAFTRETILLDDD